MKKLFFLIVILTALAIRAQAAEIKIGYVDLQEVVATSEQGKEAMKTLENIEQAKTALMKDKLKDIRKLEEEIAKQGAILNPETKKKKQTEYEQLMMEFQRMRKERDDEVKKNEAVFIQKIVMDVKNLVSEIAKKEGYTAILNEAVVLYMPEELNLTERVKKVFNEQVNQTPGN